MNRTRPSLRGKGAQIFLGEENGSGRQKAPVPESQQARIPVSQNTSKTEPQALDLSSPDKEKATFYLPQSVVTELEWAWMEARAATRKKISKSDIVALALHDVAQAVRAWKAGQAKRCEVIERFSSDDQLV